MSNLKEEKNIQTLAIIFIKDPSEYNFRLLANRIKWGLRQHIYKIVNDNLATDEILSKTLENIYFKRDLFNPDIANFSTWMYKIAYNNTLKYLQEKNKLTNSRCSEDISSIYESELYSDDTELKNNTLYEESTDFVDIIFTKEEIETYNKERVLNEIYDASVKCIDYLPDNLKMVMQERLINNKKIEDIATDNNIPISSVKNWLRKGRVVLNNTIKEKYTTLYNMYIFNLN